MLCGNYVQKISWIFESSKFILLLSLCQNDFTSLWMGLKDIHSRSKEVVNEQPNRKFSSDLQVLTHLIIKAENCHICLKSFLRDHKLPFSWSKKIKEISCSFKRISSRCGWVWKPFMQDQTRKLTFLPLLGVFQSISTRTVGSQCLLSTLKSTQWKKMRQILSGSHIKIRNLANHMNKMKQRKSDS